MNLYPTSTLTTVRFLVEPDTLFGAFESTLATARRSGIEFSGMHAAHGVHDMEVCMELNANNDDQLALYLTRLKNIIGVLEIRTSPGRIVAAIEPARDLAMIALQANEI